MCLMVVLWFFWFWFLIFKDSPILFSMMAALFQFLPVSNKGLSPLVRAIMHCHLFSWCSDWAERECLSSFKMQKIYAFWREPRVFQAVLICISLMVKGIGHFLKSLLTWELSAQFTSLLTRFVYLVFNSVVLYRLSILQLLCLKGSWQRVLPFYSLSTLVIVSFAVQFFVFHVIPIVNPQDHFWDCWSPVHQSFGLCISWSISSLFFSSSSSKGEILQDTCTGKKVTHATKFSLSKVEEKE